MIPGSTTALRAFARWRVARIAAADPVATQRRQLDQLVRRAARTQFGRDHGFDRIESVEAFQDSVALKRYEDFWSAYWQQGFPNLRDKTWPGTIPYFAVTSGTTTGRTKYIPCSREMVRANARAALDVLAWHVVNRPSSRVLRGRMLMLGGSTDLKHLAPGVKSGDLSGIAVEETPWFAKPWRYPPPEIALLTDWDAKIEAIARGTKHQRIGVVSGTPSWLVSLFARLATEDIGATCAADLWPDLSLVVHGGVHFAPYRTRFQEWLRGTPAETREVYPASEGFFAVADRGDGDGLRLNVDNGLFYEFVPIEDLDRPAPTRHWVATIEPGIDYALVVSSCAGVWSYVVGDTVRFVDVHPPRLLITGRTSYMLSAFGEHVIEAEIEQAVADAAAAINAQVTNFAVGPQFTTLGGKHGSHLYVVEFSHAIDDPTALKVFVESIDRSLCATNEDYEVHRMAESGLAPPSVVCLPPGGFAEWMRKRGQLGGQHKVPRVVTDAALFADLRQHVNNASRDNPRAT